MDAISAVLGFLWECLLGAWNILKWVFAMVLILVALWLVFVWVARPTWDWGYPQAHQFIERIFEGPHHSDSTSTNNDDQVDCVISRGNTQKMSRSDCAKATSSSGGQTTSNSSSTESNSVSLFGVTIGGNGASRVEPLKEANGANNPNGFIMKTGQPVSVDLPSGVEADVWDCYNSSHAVGPTHLAQVCQMTVRKD